MKDTKNTARMDFIPIRVEPTLSNQRVDRYKHLET